MTETKTTDERQPRERNWCEHKVPGALDRDPEGGWYCSDQDVCMDRQSDAACPGCGETHDDGPRDSLGRDWCGECVRPA